MIASPPQQAAPREAAEYHRPPWMSDEQWQHVSADLTERWLTLLEEVCRPSLRGRLPLAP